MIASVNNTIPRPRKNRVIGLALRRPRELTPLPLAAVFWPELFLVDDFAADLLVAFFVELVLLLAAADFAVDDFLPADVLPADLAELDLADDFAEERLADAGSAAARFGL